MSEEYALLSILSKIERLERLVDETLDKVEVIEETMAGDRY
jgi:hypothetical protein